MIINADLCQHLKFYVYAYIDPRDHSIFYVGKGVGSRALSHLTEPGETDKLRQIKEIRDSGQEPQIDIVSHGLDEQTALAVEAALIECIGRSNLTNRQSGNGVVDRPRRPLQDLIMEFEPQPASITEPAIIVQLRKTFRYGWSDDELYEHARGIWRIGGRRRDRAVVALAVYDGVIRGAYKIDEWKLADPQGYARRKFDSLPNGWETRWEFTSRLECSKEFQHYVGKSVKHLLKRGQQSPILFVEPDSVASSH